MGSTKAARDEFRGQTEHAIRDGDADQDQDGEAEAREIRPEGGEEKVSHDGDREDRVRFAAGKITTEHEEASGVPEVGLNEREDIEDNGEVHQVEAEGEIGFTHGEAHGEDDKGDERAERPDGR